MHRITISVSDIHYAGLKDARETFKVNGFEGYTFAGLISEAVLELYNQHPGTNPPKLDHLLIGSDGKKWKDRSMKRIVINIRPEVRDCLYLLSDCFSHHSSTSQRIAAALEVYLILDNVIMRHIRKPSE